MGDDVDPVPALIRYEIIPDPAADVIEEKPKKKTRKKKEPVPEPEPEPEVIVEAVEEVHDTANEQPDVEDIPDEPVDTPQGTRSMHTRKVAINDIDGNPKYLLGISDDITKQKEAEAERVRLQHERAQVARAVMRLCCRSSGP